MKINFDLSFCLKFLDALTEYEKLVQKIKKEKNQTPKNKHSDTTINKTPTFFKMPLNPILLDNSLLYIAFNNPVT